MQELQLSRSPRKTARRSVTFPGLKLFLVLLMLVGLTISPARLPAENKQAAFPLQGKYKMVFSNFPVLRIFHNDYFQYAEGQDDRALLQIDLRNAGDAGWASLQTRQIKLDYTASKQHFSFSFTLKLYDRKRTFSCSGYILSRAGKARACGTYKVDGREQGAFLIKKPEPKKFRLDNR